MPITCKLCKKPDSVVDFSSTQMSKPVASRTCRTCVAQSNPSNRNAALPKPPVRTTMSNNTVATSSSRPPSSGPPSSTSEPPPSKKNKQERVTQDDSNLRKLCVECKKGLPCSSFSQSQWKRPDHKKHTCSVCINGWMKQRILASASLNDPNVVKYSLEELMLASNVTLYLVENGARGPNLSKPALAKQSIRQHAYNHLQADLSLTSNRYLGVDCEGTDAERWTNYGGSGAQLVQVSSKRVVIVEALSCRREEVGGGLSDELRMIIQDATIAKVFCDQKGDIQALNAEMSPNYPNNSGAPGSVANTVDVQSLMKIGKQKLGLAQVVSASSDGLVFSKRSIKKERWWRLRTVSQMVNASGFVQYSAADAWGTWLCYELINHPVPVSEGSDEERYSRLLEQITS